MDSQSLISVLVPTGLLLLSEILALLPTKTSGILQSFILGLGRSFNIPEKDIEMATIAINKTENAQIMNTITTNPKLKNYIEYLMLNPTHIPTSTADFSKFITQETLNIINENPELFNSMYSQIISNIKKLMSSPKLSSFVNNITTEQINAL